MESQQEKKYTIELSEKQTIALDYLEDSVTEELLYGGAKGGGKSVLGCYFCFLTAKKIIADFQLEPMKYPIAVGFMGRKRGVDFNDTTLETWKRFIPEECYIIRSQEKEIVIENTVKICYGGLDDEQNIKKFNSAEFSFIFIDQAEEITIDDRGLLLGTLRLKVNGKDLIYKILYTANPAPCFLKDKFVLSTNKKRKFLQALPTDNPFLPDTYIPKLQEAFKHRPELLKAYLDGSWDELGGEKIVIKYSWVIDSVCRVLIRPVTKRLIVCDVGRFGDDETIIYAMENEKIIGKDIFSHRSTMETAGRCRRMKVQHQATLIAVDGIGVGGGVVDRLRELQEPVFEITSSSKASNSQNYKNLRAEMWWTAGEKFAERRTSITEDDILISQLSSVNYEINSLGQIQIEDKDKIKKRLGSSPDRADAYVMGLYALQYVQLKEVKKEFSYRGEQAQRPAMAG